ncbi:MAG: KpsF/GutQ family sugar-phosphate isomerase, partial [Myxococcales bacterium]|nr:KpsF/GutQ family sugar-phosphate isomerase [Myxococcales bacterium]
ASTGTPSFFLHPAEAMHGDLGRVGADDVVVLFSNSGGSQELLRLIPPLRGLGATLIAITGGRGSPLGAECDIVLPIGDCPEAGPLGLAPTTSTTVMLALGDALAMAVLGGRDFTPAQFARFHPGGALGRSLLRVSDVMRRGESNPVASADRTVLEVIDVMTSTPGKPGSVSIVDEAGRLIGFYTDGDFRRLVKTFVADDDLACLREPIARHMTRDPRSTSPDRLIAEAMRVLREHRIDQLPVVDAGHVPVGLLDVQDVLDVKVLP